MLYGRQRTGLAIPFITERNFVVDRKKFAFYMCCETFAFKYKIIQTVYEVHVIQKFTCMIFLFMKTILQHSVYFNLFFLGFMSFKTLYREINTIT